MAQVRMSWWPRSLFAVVLTLATVGSTPCSHAQEGQPKRFLRPVLLEFGTRDRPQEIQPLSETALLRKMERAQSLDADLLIVEIDSPGGMVDSSEKLAMALRDVDWAHTIAFIPREALSGAAIMALGCDEIIMGPEAHIGDAGPIFLGEDFLFRHAPEKIRSDLVSKLRTLAESTGRPPAIAEAMVDKDVEVFKVTNGDTGEISYMSESELRALEDPQLWVRGPLLEPSKKGSFLELDGRQAAQVQLADGLAPTRERLLERYELTIDKLRVLPAGWVDTLVTVLNFWPVTVLLVVCGLIALYFELAAPGLGIGGLVAGLCFALFFWSRFLGGTAGWLEVILFAAGVMFLLVELFVLPGFGIPGISGIILLLASFILASQRFGTADGLSQTELVNTMFYLTAAGVASVVGMALVTRYFGGLSLFRRLTLEPPEPHTAVAGSLSSGSPGDWRPQLGDEGVADTTLRPAGRARFGDHTRDVVSEGAFVDPGTVIRIVKLSGTHITVRAVAAEDAAVRDSDAP